jgi:peptidoglycan/xylan/chitin deacetylase (PgdA/CDA1 family)
VKRWLCVAAALVAVAVVAAGAWAAFGRGGGGASGPSAPSSTVAATGSPAPSPTVATTASPAPSPSPSVSPSATPLALPRGVGDFSRAPVSRTVGGPSSRPVPILEYHVIGAPPPGAPYPDLFVSLADFAAQMRYLEANGYAAVTLRQVYGFWHGHGRLPAKPVVLSFDDGYRQDWTNVAPILQRIGWPGVLNLCMNAVGPHRDLPVGLVHGLARAGWEIDDHTLTHPDLTTLDAAGLHSEIVVSRAVIQRLSGQPVSFFCYPAGRYDARVIAVVRAAGFLGATTEIQGAATPQSMFTLARLRVPGGESLAAFAATLAG